MSLADRLAQPPEGEPARIPRVAREFQNAVKYDGKLPSEVSVNLPEPGEDETQWRSEIKRVVGLDIPPEREVVLTDTRYWGDPESPSVYCRFKIQDRQSEPERLNLEDILKAVKKAKPPSQKAAAPRALVVAWADLQCGKVGSRGGTEELVERVMRKLAALETYARKMKCESVYLIDAGDCCEGFENVASQMFTNDLSLPEQLRVARRLFTEATVRLAKLHTRMTVASVPSNHGRWRRGKDNLGRPGDDFGIETLTAVADACKLNEDAFGHVTFVVPGMWDETIALDVHGTILAVTHGHQVTRPERIPQWWANQVHGGQPAADADVLLTGHWHSLRVQATGRSQHTGRSKWWLGAPTLDNASDHYRLSAGSDSDPGLLTFTVDALGWDHLRIL